MDLDPEGQLFLAVGAEMQDVFSRGQADAVLSAAVGPGVGLRVLVKDDDPVHRLAGLGFRHGAMDPVRIAPPVLAGVTDDIDLVPVSREVRVVLVQDDRGVFLHLGEVFIGQAVSGAGQIGGGHRSGGRFRRMRVPFDIFDVQYRLSGRGLEPFFQILAADFPDRPFLQGIIRFFTLEVVGDLGIEIGIIVSDLEISVSVGVEAKLFLHLQQQRRLSVPDNLEIAFRSLRPAHVSQVDEQFSAHCEPGDLVAENDHGAGVFQRTHQEFSLVGVYVHGNVAIEPSVVQDISGLERFPVPEIGAVELVGIDVRKLAAENAGKSAFRILCRCASQQREQRENKGNDSLYHRKLLNG